MRSVQSAECRVQNAEFATIRAAQRDGGANARGDPPEARSETPLDIGQPFMNRVPALAGTLPLNKGDGSGLTQGRQDARGGQAPPKRPGGQAPPKRPGGQAPPKRPGGQAEGPGNCQNGRCPPTAWIRGSGFGEVEPAAPQSPKSVLCPPPNSLPQPVKKRLRGLLLAGLCCILFMGLSSRSCYSGAFQGTTGGVILRPYEQGCDDGHTFTSRFRSSSTVASSAGSGSGADAAQVHKVTSYHVQGESHV